MIAVNMQVKWRAKGRAGDGRDRLESGSYLQRQPVGAGTGHDLQADRQAVGS
jgi:hypothetical protein